jgi:hypothetical protein
MAVAALAVPQILIENLERGCGVRDTLSKHSDGRLLDPTPTPRSRLFASETRSKGPRPLFVWLEPIREVWIHDEWFAASRLSMMRIMARRMNATTVVE